MTPFTLEEVAPGVFSVRFHGEAARDFGFAVTEFVPGQPIRDQVLTLTDRGPVLASADEEPLLISHPEAVAYAHQLGKQIGFGDHVHAYCRTLHLSGSTSGHPQGRHGIMNAIRAAKVHVGVGDVVRWGRHGVGRVKAIEGGRVATVKVRGSDAQVPVPIFDLHVIVPAAKPVNA